MLFSKASFAVTHSNSLKRHVLACPIVSGGIWSRSFLVSVPLVTPSQTHPNLPKTLLRLPTIGRKQFHSALLKRYHPVNTTQLTIRIWLA